MFKSFASTIKSFSYVLENPRSIKAKRTGGTVRDFLYLDKKWFHDLNIDTVIDVGANIGQFALTIINVLPNAKVYSFEPLPDCCKLLKKKLGSNANFTLFDVAVGDENCEKDIYLNISSAMSSFLDIDKLTQKHFSFDMSTSRLRVKQVKLDTFFKSINLGDCILLKIDVQGFEDSVLEGASNLLSKVKIIIIETSYIALYKDQCLFDDIYNLLKNKGYSYYGSMNTIFSPQDGSPLQEDSIFINTRNTK